MVQRRWCAEHRHDPSPVNWSRAAETLHNCGAAAYPSLTAQRSAPTSAAMSINEQHRRTAPSPACTRPIGCLCDRCTASTERSSVAVGAARPAQQSAAVTALRPSPAPSTSALPHRYRRCPSHMPSPTEVSDPHLSSISRRPSALMQPPRRDRWWSTRGQSALLMASREVTTILGAYARCTSPTGGSPGAAQAPSMLPPHPTRCMRPLGRGQPPRFVPR